MELTRRQFLSKTATAVIVGGMTCSAALTLLLMPSLLGMGVAFRRRRYNAAALAQAGISED